VNTHNLIGLNKVDIKKTLGLETYFRCYCNRLCIVFPRV